MNGHIIYIESLVALLVLIAAWTSSPTTLPHSQDAQFRFTPPPPAYLSESHLAVPSETAMTRDFASRCRSVFPTPGRNPRPAHAEPPSDSLPSPT